MKNEDIDIALDNCTGRAFAELVNAYLKSQGQTVGKVAVIEVRRWVGSTVGAAERIALRVSLPDCALEVEYMDYARVMMLISRRHMPTG